MQSVARIDKGASDNTEVLYREEVVQQLALHVERGDLTKAREMVNRLDQIDVCRRDIDGY